jgi:hypothetical protein
VVGSRLSPMRWRCHGGLLWSSATEEEGSVKSAAPPLGSPVAMNSLERLVVALFTEVGENSKMGQFGGMLEIWFGGGASRCLPTAILGVG